MRLKIGQLPALRLACGSCLLVGLLAAAAGCGRGGARSAQHVEVSGTVYYLDRGQKKPLPGGRITFINQSGFAATATIHEDGTYKIKAPVGEVKVAIDNRMLSPMSGGTKEVAAQVKQKGAGRPDAPTAEPLKGTYKQIDKKYYSADSSGLTYTVRNEAQTKDFELTD